MRRILSAKNFPVLQRFAFSNVLLAFDFDGTLAPLIANPDSGAIRHGTRRLLRILTCRYPCIVVSGRSRADVQRRLRGIGFEEAIGNHGIEPWNSSHSVAQLVKTWIPVLMQKLGSVGGVVLENKRFSLSIHYRMARSKRAARKAIIDVAQTLAGAKLVGGKLVVNVVPKGAPDKGLAVERERKRRRCDKVIYVGDDETDESVFALAPHSRYLTIRIGAKQSSRARFYIRNQRGIDRLLKSLIELRSDHPTGPPS